MGFGWKSGLYLFSEAHINGIELNQPNTNSALKVLCIEQLGLLILRLK